MKGHWGDKIYFNPDRVLNPVRVNATDRVYQRKIRLLAREKKMKCYGQFRIRKILPHF